MKALFVGGPINGTRRELRDGTITYRVAERRPGVLFNPAETVPRAEAITGHWYTIRQHGRSAAILGHETLFDDEVFDLLVQCYKVPPPACTKCGRTKDHHEPRWFCDGFTLPKKAGGQP